MSYDLELIFTWILFGWLVGFGCGIAITKALFGRIIKDKSDSRRLLESGGKLYIIRGVEKNT